MHIRDDANNNGHVDPGERTRAVAMAEGIVFGRATASPRAMGTEAVNFTKMINGLPAVVFHRDGSASEAGGFYLTSLRAATSGVHIDDTRAIELERATGRALWFKYNGSTWLQA